MYTLLAIYTMAGEKLCERGGGEKAIPEQIINILIIKILINSIRTGVRQSDRAGRP
jgi:hypothetical protein